MNHKVTIIRPPSSKLNLNFTELWAYRELLAVLTMRDIKVRYKQTVLGVAWAVLQPLVTMVIFTFIFGRLAKIPSDGLPYPVFVFSGLMAWTFFSSAVSSCSNSLVGAASIVSKVYFPRILIPMSSIGVSAIDFAVSCVIFLVLMAVYSVGFSWQVFLVPLFLFGLFLTAFGLGLWLSSITVMYRDFRFVVPFMLQIWMYVTPVIYPISFIPEDWRWLIYANPILGWVNGMRAAFLGTPIDWWACLISFCITIVILMVGFRYFNNADKRFADII